MTDRNSIFYNFPIQFPFGRDHSGLNGAVFALTSVVGGILGGMCLALLFRN